MSKALRRRERIRRRRAGPANPAAAQGHIGQYNVSSMQSLPGLAHPETSRTPTTTAWGTNS